MEVRSLRQAARAWRAGTAAATLVAALIALLVADVATPGAVSNSLPLEDPSMVVVYSGPDHDAQLFITTGSKEPMRQLTIVAPDGRHVFDGMFPGRLGQADLRLDTPEPTLAKLERVYPAGVYRWSGSSMSGKALAGTSTLRYALLDPPTITAPRARATVPATSVVARWQRARGATRIHLELEQVKTKRLFTIDVDGDTTAFRSPAQFVKPGLQYTLDIKAANRYGNLSVADVTFTVS